MIGWEEDRLRCSAEAADEPMAGKRFTDRGRADRKDARIACLAAIVDEGVIRKLKCPERISRVYSELIVR